MIKTIAITMLLATGLAHAQEPCADKATLNYDAKKGELTARMPIPAYVPPPLPDVPPGQLAAMMPPGASLAGWVPAPGADRIEIKRDGEKMFFRSVRKPLAPVTLD
jgi:hypothetical protein